MTQKRNEEFIKFQEASKELTSLSLAKCTDEDLLELRKELSIKISSISAILNLRFHNRTHHPTNSKNEE